MLDREGALKSLKLGYYWPMAPGHVLTPSVAYVHRDLDGDAMAADGYQLELSYLYTAQEHWEFAVNLLGGQLEADEVNPIYNKGADLDRMGVSLAAPYTEPFGLQDWRARAAISYGEEDNGIDFYDNNLRSVSLGMLYSF